MGRGWQQAEPATRFGAAYEEQYPEVDEMAKFAFFFTYTSETVKALVDQPSDRAAVVGQLCESAGGHMDAWYVMFGAWDGFVIADLPDSTSAAAVSLAVSSSGAIGRVETHELLESGQLVDALGVAGSLTYSPPGT